MYVLLITIFWVRWSFTFPPIETCKGPLSQSPFCDEQLTVSERVEFIIDKLSFNEKLSIIDYMTRGEYLKRLDFQKYRYVCEGLHGLWTTFCNPKLEGVYFPTSFPQVINLGRTFDFENIRKMGGFISDEGRALNNAGLSDISYWSPNVNIFRDPRWGRGQEVAGEDPFLVSEYGLSYIQGLQFGSDLKYLKGIAGVKHFVAYDLERSGSDHRFRFNAVVSKQDLEETHYPPFRTAVEKARSAQVMCSYNALNGIPACASKELLETTLREKLHFEGFVVSDCFAIKHIADAHKYAPTPSEAAALALKAGTDLNCGDMYKDHLLDAFNQGLIDMTHIDRAVRRVLKVRMQTGEFDLWEGQVYKTIPMSVVGQKKHTDLSCLLARESIVLLKNSQGVLPLSLPLESSVALVGPFFNATTQMQGVYAGDGPFWVTPIQGIMQYINEDRVVYSGKGCEVKLKSRRRKFDFGNLGIGLAIGLVCGIVFGIARKYRKFRRYRMTAKFILRSLAYGTILGLILGIIAGYTDTSSWALFYDFDYAAIKAAKNADVSILFMGIDTSIEAEDRDRTSLQLPYIQRMFLRKYREYARGKRLILVLFHGGPVDLTWEKSQMDAIVDVGYPSMCGGDALAQVLFGAYSPSGRLTTTVYPEKYTKECEYTKMDMRPSRECPAGRTYKFYTGDPVYEFGHGLSYTKFKYEFEREGPLYMRIIDPSTTEFFPTKSASSPGRAYEIAGDRTVAVIVTNVGGMDSDVVVLAFSKNTFNADAPKRQLIGARRVFVKSGGRERIEFDVDESVFEYVNKNGERIVEKGLYQIILDDKKTVKNVHLN